MRWNKKCGGTIFILSLWKKQDGTIFAQKTCAVLYFILYALYITCIILYYVLYFILLLLILLLSSSTLSSILQLKKLQNAGKIQLK